MKRLPILLIIVFAFSLKACAQQEFNVPATFNAGFRFSLTGPIYTSLPNSGTPDWNTILNKPAFSTIATSGDYNDLKNLPQQIALSQAIKNLGYLPIPGQPTSALSSIIPPTGSGGIIYDTTAKCYKLWDGTQWSKVVITNQ